MKSSDTENHVLDAKSTVNVPLDYHDIEAILEFLPESEDYENLREHLKRRQKWNVE